MNGPAGAMRFKCRKYGTDPIALCHCLALVCRVTLDDFELPGQAGAEPDSLAGAEDSVDFIPGLVLPERAVEEGKRVPVLERLVHTRADTEDSAGVGSSEGEAVRASKRRRSVDPSGKCGSRVLLGEVRVALTLDFTPLMAGAGQFDTPGERCLESARTRPRSARSESW